MRLGDGREENLILRKVSFQGPEDKQGHPLGREMCPGARSRHPEVVKR